MPRRDERNRKRKHSEPRRVRTPKTTTYEPIRTVCVQADEIGVPRDETLQDSQGRAFVLELDNQTCWTTELLDVNTKSLTPSAA